MKHALPLIDTSRRAKEWPLSEDGTARSRELAGRLRPFIPFRLVSSVEPKASGTADVVASELGIRACSVEGLHEIDRPVLPWMGPEEHERFNARLFTDFDRPVVGSESARQALDRFDAALTCEIERMDDEHLVVISHGTVISLFVGAHDDGVDAFGLWRKLQCCAFVVLDATSLREIMPGTLDA